MYPVVRLYISNALKTGTGMVVHPTVTFFDAPGSMVSFSFSAVPFMYMEQAMLSSFTDELIPFFIDMLAVLVEKLKPFTEHPIELLPRLHVFLNALDHGAEGPKVLAVELNRDMAL